MRPLGVVVSDPDADDLAGLVEIKEDCLVEELVAHPTVEGFDVAVLHRFAGRDVVPFDLMIDCPAEDRVRGELGAVGIIFLGLPVSSMSGGNIAPQIAHLKGEMDAVRKASTLNNCGQGRV